eukprot:1160004-Pelagomonas_calceolata.AAC.2
MGTDDCCQSRGHTHTYKGVVCSVQTCAFCGYIVSKMGLRLSSRVIGYASLSPEPPPPVFHCLVPINNPTNGTLQIDCAFCGCQSLECMAIQFGSILQSLRLVCPSLTRGGMVCPV